MNIFWSDFATEMLNEVYSYYKANGSVRIAKKIKNEIFTATNQLILHPHSGQIEMNLERLEEGHRYLVKEKETTKSYTKRYLKEFSLLMYLIQDKIQ